MRRTKTPFCCRASQIKPMSLEKMAERYAKGELNQIVK